MKILVVHRDSEVIKSVREGFADSTSEFVVFHSGLDALLFARAARVDAMIIGDDLPIITGYELVRSVRTISQNREVPVFLIGAHNDYKTNFLCRALGIRQITQPDNGEQLRKYFVGNFKTLSFS